MAERRHLRGVLRFLIVAGALIATGPTSDGAFAQTATADDTKLPIEITADSLEVIQKEQLAVFRGNVDAVQGAMRLTANEIWVRYRPDSKQEVQGAISRIDASGRVRFSTPSETAQGDVGVYDLDTRIVTLTGSVVLTRDGNVIRGEKLMLNLATGQSKIESSRRVRGLFQPNKSGSGS